MLARLKDFGLGAVVGIVLGATVLGAFASLLLVGAAVLGAGAAAHRWRRRSSQARRQL
jgi:hypothetical protein